MIEQGEECGDEDDGGQNLERENEVLRGIFHSQFAKDELGANEGIAEQQIHVVAGDLKNSTARTETQHKECESELQTEAPQDGREANGFSISGKDVGQSQYGDQAQHADESAHRVGSFPQRKFCTFAARKEARR